MSATLLGTVGVSLTRDEWHELRKAGIGGSDAPAISGAVSWASPMSVYLDKLGLTEPTEVNEAMEWGNRLEVPITKKVEEVTGRAVEFRQMFYAHGDYPWMLATVDGITTNDQYEEGLVEIKTTGAWRAKTWKDDVPLHVWIQTQHDMAVVDLPWAIVGVLIGGQRFELHHVTRDDSYIAQLIELERAFVENHLVPQIPPPIDGSKASEHALKILFPEDDGSEIVLGDEADVIVDEYLCYQLEEKIAAAGKLAAANKLRELLGAAERATTSEYRIKWATVVTNRLDTKAARAALDLSPYMRESVSRRLTVNAMEAEE